MDYHIVLAALSGVLEVASVVPYIRDIVKGETRPNVVSFVLWTTLQVIALLAQLKAGASWSAIVVVMLTLSNLVILVFAFRGYGYRKYGYLDGVSFALCVGALVAWQTTGNPLLAIFFSIVADVCASIPTLVKTYREPRTEHAGAWGLVTLALLLGTLSTERYDAANLAMPFYLTLMMGTIFILALRGRKVSSAS